MSLTAFALIVLAGLIHAGWNIVAKKAAGDARFAFFTAFGLLAAIGLPGSAGFIAELHVLVGGYQRWGGWVLILCLTMLIAAAYSLRVIGRLCLKGEPMELSDMTRTEAVAAGLLTVCILGFGIWPAPLLDLIAGSVGEVARLFGT